MSLPTDGHVHTEWRLRRAESSEAAGLGDDVARILDDVHSREIGVFPDGCIIETEWSGPPESEGGLLFER